MANVLELSQKKVIIKFITFDKKAKRRNTHTIAITTPPAFPSKPSTMFIACNAGAIKSKQIAVAQKQRDDKIKKKIATSRAKWSKESLSTEGESIRSASSESFSKKKQDSSIKSGSARDDDRDLEKVTRGMKEKALAILFIEEQFDKNQEEIDAANKRYDSCKQVITARMESRSAVGIILAINEYKKLLAKEATARRIIDQLESLLSEVVDCVELPGTIAEYREKVTEILNQAPVNAETLSLTGVTAKIVSAELEKLGIARN